LYINFWYAAIESEKLQSEPVKIRMLGQDFVLFRDSDGETHCLSNTCIHRGASLAHGKIKGDCIECPYHGWRFKGLDGSCVKIPSLGKTGKIPARAKVDRYPTKERYGVVFCFLGDLPENERPPIMEVPEWGQEGWGFTLMNYQWEANFQRAIENTLDPAHTEFVHPSMGYQGEREDYDVPDLSVVDKEWGTGTMTTFVSPDLPHEKMKGLKGEGQMEAGAGNHGPSMAWTYLHFSPKAWAHQYAFTTPIDEHHINRFFLQARNFRTDNSYDQTINERNTMVVEQDKNVVQKLEPFFTPGSGKEEVLVKADAVIVRYREYLKAWERKGWRIDTATRDALSEEKSFAIPSPARLTSKQWAIDTVPLIEAVDTAAEAAE